MASIIYQLVMGNFGRLLAILGIEYLIYRVCSDYFEWYFLLLIPSILGLVYLLKYPVEGGDRRLVELAVVETFFVTVLYALFFVGHSAISSYLILLLIFVPQGGLFILASYKAKNSIKALNTAIHLAIATYWSIESASAALAYNDYPIIFPSDINAYYTVFYLIWVIPFLISGRRYYSLNFILVEGFSIFLACLHDDFLSMRLFTAQASFILFFLLKIDIELESTRYLKRTNAVLSTLSLVGLLLVVVAYFLKWTGRY